MNNISLLIDILRYSAQISIIYILLRYLPYVNLNQTQALILTTVLMILCICIERICVNFNKGLSNIIKINNDEGKCDSGCNTNSVEAFKPESKKTCRMVCESVDNNEKEKVEKIEESKEKVEKFEDSKIGLRYADRAYTDVGYDDRYGFGGMFYDEYPFYNRFRADPDEKQKKIDMVKEEIQEQRVEDRLNSTDGYKSRYQETGYKSEVLRTTDNKRRITGEIDDEIPYTDYNHLPVAAGYKSKDYEYGYNFLPPEKWYRQPPRPPICVTQQRSAVLPAYTNGAPLDVKEWHTSRRITPPDRINVAYIEDKLNGGR